jgi:hypothetical protein
MSTFLIHSSARWALIEHYSFPDDLPEEGIPHLRPLFEFSRFANNYVLGEWPRI